MQNLDATSAFSIPEVPVGTNTTVPTVPATTTATSRQPAATPQFPVGVDRQSIDQDSIGRGIWRARIENNEAQAIFGRLANAGRFITLHHPDVNTNDIRTWKHMRTVLLDRNIVPDPSDPQQQEYCRYMLDEEEQI